MVDCSAVSTDAVYCTPGATRSISFFSRYSIVVSAPIFSRQSLTSSDVSSAFTLSHRS